MIRGLTGTVLWTCLAGAVGVGLFFVKHEVKDLELRLTGLNQEIQRNQEAVHVLKAEWSYLNDPSRLRQLSERHLGMKPMSSAQIATFDTLGRMGQPTMAAAPKASAAALARAPAAPASRPVSIARAEGVSTVAAAPSAPAAVR